MNRPPIITVMGHVDHGKTTLLDALRNTHVVATESGGITQHTGASQVDYKGKKITFIDTPGHEAFSEMRARGGKIADIAILVVAANDGVKPQTKEALSHIRAAGVPVIVAITKIDVPDNNIQKVKKQIFDEGLVLEEFGGDVICVEVSALKGTNLNKLLESIIALSEMLDISDSSKDDLEGFILESTHNTKKGFVANVVIRKGTLKTGDEIIIGNNHVLKVKSLFDYGNKPIKEAIAGSPCEILGLKKLSQAGEVFKKYKGELVEETFVDLDSKKDLIKDDTLNVLLRADTYGTLEAIKSSVAKILFEGKKINLILAECGEIKESDVNLASATGSIVIAFKVTVPTRVKDRADQVGVLVREYDVIYNLVEELTGALEGVFEIQEEKIKGRAEILKLYPLPSGDVIAGCKVSHGRLRSGDSISILDVDMKTELFKSRIKNLKKGTAKVELVGKDTECGVLLLSNFEKLKEGYFINVL